MLKTFLNGRATWFVVAAWACVALATFASIYFGALIVVGDAYRDPQLVYPFHRTVLFLMALAVLVAFATAATSSYLSRSGYRSAASSVAICIWFALLVATMITTRVMSTAPLERFDFLVDSHRLSVPRRFKGANDPPNSFAAVMCLTPVGIAGSDCKSGAGVLISSSAKEYRHWYYGARWSQNRNAMGRAVAEFGYDKFTELLPYNAQRIYFIRTDPVGELKRVVSCGGDICDIETVEGIYFILIEHVSHADLLQLDQTITDVVELIDSWRID